MGYTQLTLWKGIVWILGCRHCRMSTAVPDLLSAVWLKLEWGLVRTMACTVTVCVCPVCAVRNHTFGQALANGERSLSPGVSVCFLVQVGFVCFCGAPWDQQEWRICMPDTRTCTHTWCICSHVCWL